MLLVLCIHLTDSAAVAPLRTQPVHSSGPQQRVQTNKLSLGLHALRQAAALVAAKTHGWIARAYAAGPAPELGLEILLSLLWSKGSQQLALPLVTHPAAPTAHESFRMKSCLAWSQPSKSAEWSR